MSKGWPVNWQSFTDFVEPTQSILQAPLHSLQLMSPLRCGTGDFTLEPLLLDLPWHPQRSTDVGTKPTPPYRARTDGVDQFRETAAPTKDPERSAVRGHAEQDWVAPFATVPQMASVEAKRCRNRFGSQANSVCDRAGQQERFVDLVVHSGDPDLAGIEEDVVDMTVWYRCA